MSALTIACWLCHSEQVRMKRKGHLAEPLHPEHFRITATDYGITGDIYECSHCGFLFCPTVGNVLSHYERMTDSGYEATRNERALQAKQLLKKISRHKPRGDLLDVGAGSGILVEQALHETYNALGIEPSLALSQTAQNLHLPVRTGILPQPDFRNRFDVVTLIDVIEHVDMPRALLAEAVACMKDDGICAIATPDVASLAARIMQKKWWHYRLAHIGYFDRATLAKLAESVGLEIIALYRPAWYFPADYLGERLLSYLPPWLRIRPPKWLGRLTIPLNLFDSLLVVCRKTATTSHSPIP